jgi:hypothetical protein
MVFEDPETHDEVVGVVVVKGGCILAVDVYVSIVPRFGTFGPEWWLGGWPGLLAFFFYVQIGSKGCRKFDVRWDICITTFLASC